MWKDASWEEREPVGELGQLLASKNLGDSDSSIWFDWVGKIYRSEADFSMVCLDLGTIPEYLSVFDWSDWIIAKKLAWKQCRSI